MATRKRKTTTKKRPSLLERTAELVVRPEVFGLVLVGVAIFTLLSLMTGARGSVTESWIQFLEHMVGYGSWGIPLVAGAIGMWIIIRAVEQMPDLRWQVPAGITLLFLAYLTGAALLAPGVPEATGGVIGSRMATTLDASFGSMGAWTAVSVGVVVGIILLTDRLLVDAGLETWVSTLDWWRRTQDSRGQAVIQPALPVPSGRLPWWKRWREKWMAPKEAPPPPPRSNAPHLVPAEPQRGAAAPQRVPQGQAYAQPSQQPHGVPAAQQTPAGAAAAGAKQESDLLTPRVFGGEQEWTLPSLPTLLNDWDRTVDTDEYIRSQGRLIQETLSLFGVPADFEGAYKGPAVTQYLIKPGYIERVVRGEERRVKVKVSKIAGLSNDLALALAAPSVRIEAPVPGTSYVGVEVPNHEANVVGLKELMESDAFRTLKANLPVALGEDVKGQPIVTDLTRTPHLLIAGATGSGKSVCINSIISCLLLTKTPDDLRLLMIDPKMVELNVYNDAPHLLSPVVNEIDRASSVLFWAVKEMERRYQLFSQAKARDITRYNDFLRKRNEKPLPYIVIIVDEMADLMMASPEDVEKYICRIAQMARAVGMHLIIATQRPSVDVITGLIKANFPARIAFAVSSQVDSRVILDVPGAERLLGRGDMLFMPPDASKLERVQGTYLSDDEIQRIVAYWKGIRTVDRFEPSASGEAMTPGAAGLTRLDGQRQAQPGRQQPGGPPPAQPTYTNESMDQPPLFEQIEQMKQEDSRDELFDDAVRIVQDSGRGSVSLLQRKLRIGYSRASRIVDQLEEAGILGPDLGGNQGRELLGDDDAQMYETPHVIGGSDDDDTEPQSPRVWM